MYCPTCGAEVAPEQMFCPNCGREMKNEWRERAYDRKGILIRAESGRDRLDQWCKDAIRTCSAVQIVVDLPFFIWLIWGVFAAKSSDVSGGTVATGVIFFIMSVVAGPFFTRTQKAIKSEYARYVGLCEVESLILDEDKAYGTTSQGDLLLNYDQISTAKLYPAWAGAPKRMYANSTLEIVDTAGNRFEFLSFSNAQELYAILNNKV